MEEDTRYIKQLNSVATGELLRFRKRIFYENTGTERYPSDEEIYQARKLIRLVSIPVILLIIWLLISQ